MMEFSGQLGWDAYLFPIQSQWLATIANAMGEISPSAPAQIPDYPEQVAHLLTMMKEPTRHDMMMVMDGIPRNSAGGYILGNPVRWMATVSLFHDNDDVDDDDGVVPIV